MGEISSPISYLTIYYSGLMPSVEIKEKDQEQVIQWSLKGLAVDPGSPEAKGEESQTGTCAS